MLTQVLTHSPTRVTVRRFFVNQPMRGLFMKIESEISNILSHDTNKLSLSMLHAYVRLRIKSLDLSQHREFIDLAVLEAHMLDYCDFRYSAATGLNMNMLTYRMFKYSEPLAIHKELE